MPRKKRAMLPAPAAAARSTSTAAGQAPRGGRAGRGDRVWSGGRPADFAGSGFQSPLGQARAFKNVQQILATVSLV
jgi:hypothetical protein